MQNTASEITEITTGLGLARAVALFDGIRAISSHSRFTDDKQLDAEALIRYVDTATDKVATHLAKRGVALETVCEPENVVDVDAEIFELTDEEIDAQANEAARVFAADE